MFAKLLIALIHLYQIMISPLLGSCCRFQPTCSVYAIEALEIHGFFRGGWMILKRLFKCAPWHPGGYDPLPNHSSDEKRGKF